MGQEAWPSKGGADEHISCACFLISYLWTRSVLGKALGVVLDSSFPHILQPAYQTEYMLIWLHLISPTALFPSSAVIDSYLAPRNLSSTHVLKRWITSYNSPASNPWKAFQRTWSPIRLLHHSLRSPQELWSGPCLSFWPPLLHSTSPLSVTSSHPAYLLFLPLAKFISTLAPSPVVSSPLRSPHGFLPHSSRSPSNVTSSLDPFIWNDTPPQWCYSLSSKLTIFCHGPAHYY